MRNKILRRFLIAAILLAVPLVLLCFAFLLPPQYDRTYLAGLQDKNTRLKTADAPRIILIGGSGAAFDVRSDLLEQELPGYSVVNYGLYAGLGTTVMLELAEPYIEAGDLVIFLPEQNEQTLSSFFDAESLWQASDGTFPSLLDLNTQERGAMIGAFGRFAAGKARLFFTGTEPSGDGIYARSSFNAYGDIACGGREYNTMAEGYDPNMPVKFDPALPADDFINRVNEFAESCEKKGAAFCFSFCPMNASAIPYAERARIGTYVESLAAKLACPLLGTAEDAIMDENWFFDTNYHLNAAGQILYTARLAGLIKAMLGDGSPVSIELPVMPSGGSLPVWEGDSSDVDCFLYEPYADGFLITGLSAQGKTRESLTVPSLYMNLPVRSFHAAVFAGNDTLRTVTISRNITWIPDEAFSGCSVLERIILNNPAPETCSVGRHLLDGSAAVITVPASAFSAYATNYFWSLYSLRMETDSRLG